MLTQRHTRIRLGPYICADILALHLAGLTHTHPYYFDGDTYNSLPESLTGKGDGEGAGNKDGSDPRELRYDLQAGTVKLLCALAKQKPATFSAKLSIFSIFKTCLPVVL